MLATPQIQKEIQRRRTFAIISHPDAGKTTLTEKLLYHGGVIHETGEVKGKSGSKAVTSDWMELERQKGISITSSVMTFDYNDLRVNLLDTPGHKDFSEDTYRVLMAVDSAAMLIDVAKGVEERTKKLYEVCRLRKIPIFTFVNKLDREGKDPLTLIDEVEKTLNMQCYPVTWPLGIGQRFRGIYNRLTQEIWIYDQRREEVEDYQKIPFVKGKDDQILYNYLDKESADQVLEELDLIESALPPFDVNEFLTGQISPVTFGSAKQNFGVDTFLQFFTKYAPGPQARVTKDDQKMDPLDAKFTGFVFKIQANMDRRHRDRIAFIRICSGKFERGMKVQHSRLERELRLSYSSQFVAADKETVDEAYAGDIVGVGDTGNFAIGDCVSSSGKVQFEDIPKFAPELFGRLSVRDALKRQKLQEALKHLSEEGAIQLFIEPHIGPQDPIIGAVGELQFEVLLHRLQDEYNLEVKLARLPYSVCRWPRTADGKAVTSLKGGANMAEDLIGNPVVLVNQEWDLNWLKRENPDVEFQTSISRAR
ncbi:peptide chain release factor 3 [Bdellovibrio sp. ZAP7]|uniref:peptide chain release factor 3 n=1 Tax=Bdellovibrio sp. ZAP7 TaxID=2231053 RepID=UPI001158031F|nr:peptide chain release factor 3 [Bdellovibrio sp. ZAP7]QDK45422.1 peptide chain release factor 3 [Bdellovibrio sp. ZAP7]